MEDSIPKNYKSYFQDFLIFSCIIAALCILFLYFNYGLQKDLRSGAAENSFEPVNNILIEIEHDFATSSRIINTIINTQAFIEPSLLLPAFTESYEYATGYIYYNTIAEKGIYYNYAMQFEYSLDELTLIPSNRSLNDIFDFLTDKNPIFYTVSDKNTGKAYIAYISPIYIESNFSGFIGLLVDLDLAKETAWNISSQEYANVTDYYYFIDFSGNVLAKHNDHRIGNDLTDTIYETISHDFFDKGIEKGFFETNFNGTKWFCDYMILCGSIIAINAYEPPLYMGGNLVFLIIIFISSILFIGIMHSIYIKSSIVYFAGAFIMRLQSDKLKPTDINSNKALMAFHTGIIGLLLVNLIYNLLAGNLRVFEILFYTVFLLIVSFGIIIYSSIKIPKQLNAAITVFAIAAPFVVHILNGGFSGYGKDYASGAIIWMISGLIIGLFRLRRRAARNIFYLYTFLLFADIFIEAFIMRSLNGIYVFEFVSCTFFLGYALFFAVEIYITCSQDNYTELDYVFNQLKNTQSMLIQREKMGSLGQLVAGIAHEINTPIGAIKASSENLISSIIPVSARLAEDCRNFSKDDLDALYKLLELSIVSISEMKNTMEIRRSRQQLREYLQEINVSDFLDVSDILIRLEICEIEKIETNLDIFKKPNILGILNIVSAMSPFVTGAQTILFATNKVSKIVFALKSYAHKDSDSSRQYLDIVTNIDNILILHQNQLKKGITVIKNYNDVPEVYGDPDELGQVWTNLIQNSIYAMNEVGTLTITIKQSNPAFVKVSIIDSGIGIDEKNLEKIFEPLFTTKPLGEGTGLGLDICKKIIKNHCGSISAESTKGAGTAIHVELPVRRNL